MRGYQRVQAPLRKFVLTIGELLASSIYVASLVFVLAFYLITPQVSLSGAIYSLTRPMAPGWVNWIYLMVMLSLYLMVWLLFALIRARVVSDPIDWYRFLPNSALGGLDFILMALILMTIPLLVAGALGWLTIELPYEPVIFLDGIISAALVVHNREEASYSSQEVAERNKRIRRRRQIKAELEARRHQKLQSVQREIENVQRKAKEDLHKLDATITRLRAQRDVEREALKRDVLRLEEELRRASLELEQGSQTLETDMGRMARIRSSVEQARSLEQEVSRLQGELAKLQAEHRSWQEKWPGERSQVEARVREFQRERDERVRMEEDRAEELRTKLAEPGIPETKKARLTEELDKLETWLAGKRPHQSRVARLEKKIERLTEQLEAGEEEWLTETARLEGEIGRLTIESEKQEQGYRGEVLWLEQEADRLLAEWAEERPEAAEPEVKRPEAAVSEAPPSLWRRIWAAIVRFVRRLLGRPEVTPPAVVEEAKPDMWEKVNRLMAVWRKRRHALESRLAALKVEIEELPERRAERERLGRAKIEELEEEIKKTGEQREERKRRAAEEAQVWRARERVLANPLDAIETRVPTEFAFLERPYDPGALPRWEQIEVRIVRRPPLEEAPKEYLDYVLGEVEDEYTIYALSEQFQNISGLRGYPDLETAMLVKTFAEKSVADDPEEQLCRPVDVLEKARGNVRSRSLLTMALLRYLGFEVALFSVYASPEHWVLGIGGAEGLPGSFIIHRGRPWYYCEVDSPEPIGELPEQYARLRFEPLAEVR